MNIFVTSSDPVLSAMALDDIRVNKMIIESCQMLMTALTMNGVPQHTLPNTKKGVPFKPGWQHHPCTKWASRSSANYIWLLEHLKALLAEYNYRSGKKHSFEAYVSFLESNASNVKHGDLEPFQNSSKFPHVFNTEHAYKETMNDKWRLDKIKVKWTKRVPPSWIWTIKTIKIGEVYYRIDDKVKKQMGSIAGILSTWALLCCLRLLF